MSPTALFQKGYRSFAKTLPDMALPCVEKGGEIAWRADLVNALTTQIDNYTIADVVRAIGDLEAQLIQMATDDDVMATRAP